MKSILAVALIASLCLVGCRSKRYVFQPVLPVRKPMPVRVVKPVLALPPRTIGCAWDYPPMPPGLYFEVWASTNLVNWTLATNTVEKMVRFPVKPCEFYKVRARDTNGLVSDWATK